MSDTLQDRLRNPRVEILGTTEVQDMAIAANELDRLQARIAELESSERRCAFAEIDWQTYERGCGAPDFHLTVGLDLPRYCDHCGGAVTAHAALDAKP